MCIRSGTSATSYMYTCVCVSVVCEYIRSSAQKFFSKRFSFSSAVLIRSEWRSLLMKEKNLYLKLA